MFFFGDKKGKVFGCSTFYLPVECQYIVAEQGEDSNVDLRAMASLQREFSLRDLETSFREISRIH